MDKLSREEVKELVEKISYGMGSDEEVSEWIQKIMDSVPNRNVWMAQPFRILSRSNIR